MLYAFLVNTDLAVTVSEKTPVSVVQVPLPIKCLQKSFSCSHLAHVNFRLQAWTLLHLVKGTFLACSGGGGGGGQASAPSYSAEILESTEQGPKQLMCKEAQPWTFSPILTCYELSLRLRLDIFWLTVLLFTLLDNEYFNKHLIHGLLKHFTLGMGDTDILHSHRVID